MADEKLINQRQMRSAMEAVAAEIEEKIQEYAEQDSSAIGASASLSTSWTEQSNGTFAQTVSVSGVTASNQVIVDCALSGVDIDADIAVLEAWGMVNRATQAAGSLTFYCYGDVPAVAIPLNVVVTG